MLQQQTTKLLVTLAFVSICIATPRVPCEYGKYYKTGNCEVCPPGYHCNDGAKIPCEPGYYQALERQTYCRKCPSYSIPSTKSAATKCDGCIEGTYDDKNSDVRDTICRYCPTGYYLIPGQLGDYKNYGAVACKICPPGHQCNDQAKTACKPGSYQALQGKTYCNECPTNSIPSTTSAATKCEGCIKGTYDDENSDVRDTICRYCPSHGHYVIPGQFGDYKNSGAGTCKMCPPGHQCNGQAKTACKPGSYQALQGKTYCNECPTNSIPSTTSAATKCEGCIKGTYDDENSDVRDTICRYCPSHGHYVIPGQFGDYKNSGAGACKMCPRGHQCNGQAKTACKPGSYQALQGKTYCNECPTNSIPSTTSAATKCEGCIKGTYDDENSDVRDTICRYCPSHGHYVIPGHFGDYKNSGAGACKICPPGHQCNGQAKTACKPGSYQALQGKTYCNECPRNSIPSTKSAATKCEGCIKGTYDDENSDVRDTICRYCPSHGYYLIPDQLGNYNNSGAGACKICPPGHQCNNEAKTACKPGYYQAWEGMTSCNECPGNSIPSTKSAATKCDRCIEGTYDDKNSDVRDTVCRYCPTGYYVISGQLGDYNNSGAGACKICPPGHRCNNISKKYEIISFQDKEIYVSYVLGTLLIIILLAFSICFYIMYTRKWYVYMRISHLSANQVVYKKNEKLGSGNFADVYKATIRDGRQIYKIFCHSINKPDIVASVKVLKTSADQKSISSFLEEAILISGLHHSNIVKPIGICLDSRPIMLAMEYMNGGSLKSYLQQLETQAKIVKQDLLKIIVDVAKACSYLEKNGIIHRDLSAKNLLVHMTNNKLAIVKIGDFGLAKDIRSMHDRLYKTDCPIFPVAFTAPEGFSGIFSSKSDVWSFGVVVWEVFSWGANPFGECTLNTTHNCNMKALTAEEIRRFVCGEKQALNKLPNPCTADFPDSIQTIMNSCWLHDACNRPTFQEILFELTKSQALMSGRNLYANSSDEVQSIAVDKLPELFDGIFMDGKKFKELFGTY